jgi:hypothetical protein
MRLLHSTKRCDVLLTSIRQHQTDEHASCTHTQTDL